MTQRSMTMVRLQELARIFKQRRKELKLSTREVAARSGVSHGTVNILERGTAPSPRPDILKAVAGALDIPLSDIFAVANWIDPGELPTLQPYLRAKYGLTKTEAAELNDYLTRLQAGQSGARSGPIDREDEH